MHSKSLLPILKGIVFFVTSLNISAVAQIEGGNMPGLSTPKNVEASKLSFGSFVGDVNTFSGTYQTSVPLGSVSTPGGLTYSVTMDYSSKNIVSNNPEHVDGIPYGEGWSVSVPSISIKSEVRKNRLKGRNGNDWVFKKDNFTNKELYPDGDSYYYYPFLSIPGVASGKLILKHQVNNRSVFVLEKFEKYVQAEFYSGIWEVILDDGTVFVFDYLKNNMRNATNNRLDRFKYQLVELDSTEFDTTSYYDTVCVEYDNNVYPPVCLRDSVYLTRTFVKKFDNVLVDAQNNITRDLAKTIHPIVERTAWYPSQMYNPRQNHQMIFFEYETFGKINFHQEYLQNNFQFFFLEFIIDSLFHLYGNSVDNFFQFQTSVPDLSSRLPYMKSYQDFDASGFLGNKPHRAGTVFRDIFLKSVIAADMSNGYIPIEKLDLNYETFDVNQYAGQNPGFNTTDANMLLWKSNSLVERLDSLYSIAPAYHRGSVSNPKFMAVNEPTAVPFYGVQNRKWSRYRHLRSDEFLRNNISPTTVTGQIYRNSNIFDSWVDVGNLNAHAYTTINWRNPFSASYAGGSYYMGREEIDPFVNSILFDHSFIESERLSFRQVPGETYEIRTLIQGPNSGQKIMNFDLEVITGKNTAQPSTDFVTKNTVQINSVFIHSFLNNYLDPEKTNAQYKSHSIFNTFNNLVKWGFGWSLNNDGHLYTSNNFVMPNLPNNYQGFHVRIGPAVSDQYNNFGLWPEERLNLQDPNSQYSLISNFGNFSSYFAHFRNQKLGSGQSTTNSTNPWNNSIYDHADNTDNGHLRLWDTDGIPNNFGNGSPWYIMDKAQVAGASTNMYVNTLPKDYPHHRFWWNNFPIEGTFCYNTGNPFATFANKPTLADENYALHTFQINRISKNPYVLKNVKKYKLSGHYDYLAEYLNQSSIWDQHLVEQKDFIYDIWLMQIPNNEFDQLSGTKTYADGSSYFRNVFLLSEVRNTNVESTGEYIATHFEYDSIPEIQHDVPCITMFNNCPNQSKMVRLGNVILMSKVRDELGGETVIEYSQNYDAVYTHGTGSPSDFGRLQQISDPNFNYLQDLPPAISMEVVFPVARIGKLDENNQYRYRDYEFETIVTDNGLLNNWLFKVNNINNTASNYPSILGYEKATVYLPALNNSQPYKRARIEYVHHGGENMSLQLNGLEDNHPYLLMGKIKEKSEFDDDGNLIKMTKTHYKATKAYASYRNRRQITYANGFYPNDPCQASRFGRGYTPGDFASAYGDYLDLNAIADNYINNFSIHTARLLKPDVADIDVSPFDVQRFVDAYYAPGNYSYFVRVVKEETFDFYPVDHSLDNNSTANSVSVNPENPVGNGSSVSRINGNDEWGYIHSAKEFFYFDADERGRSNNSQYKKLLRKGFQGDSLDFIFLSDENHFWQDGGYAGMGTDFNNPAYTLEYRRNKSYEPSWQLSAVKTYSDDYPGAFSLEEKFYLFDLQKLYRYKTLLGTNPCMSGNSYPFDPKFTHKLKDEIKAIKFDFDNLVRSSVFQTITTSVIPGLPPSRKYEFVIYDDYKSGVISIDTDDTDTLYTSIPREFCDVLDPTINTGALGRTKQTYVLNPSELRSRASIEIMLTALEKDGTLNEYLFKEHGLKKQSPNKREVLDNVFQNVNVLKSAHIAYDTFPIYPDNIYSDHSDLTSREDFLFYEYAQVTDSVARPKIKHFPDGSWVFYDSMIAVTYNKFIPRLPFPNIKYADIIGRNRFGQVMVMKDQSELKTLLTFPKRDYTWFIDPNKYVKRYNWNGDPANGNYTLDSVKCAYRVMNFGRFGLPDSKTVGYGRPDSLYTKYSYDNKYRLKKMIDPNLIKTEYEYDGFGRLKSTKVNDSLIAGYNYSYWNTEQQNSLAHTFQIKSNYNYVETVTYNTNNDGQVSRLHYDPMGREFHNAFNHYDFQNQHFTKNTIHSGSIFYDNWDRPIKNFKPFLGTYPDLEVEQNFSGYFSEQLSENSSRGLNLRSADFGISINSNHTIRNSYEIVDRGVLQNKIEASPSILNQIAPSQNQIFMKQSSLDQDGNKTVVFTNSLGQKVASSTHLDNSKINTYYVYDADGNVRKTINDKLQVREYIYNSLGLLFRSVDPDAGTTINWYDQKGNLRFTQDNNLRAKGLYGSIREFKYDAYGRLTEQNFRNLHAAIPATITLNLNARSFDEYALGDRIILGNVLKPEKKFYYGSPQSIPSYIRDEVIDEYVCSPYINGKLSRSESYDQDANLIEVNYHFYNRNGQLRSYASQFNPNGIASNQAGILSRIYYKYDRQGRVLKTTVDLGGDDIVDFNTKNHYDHFGRLASISGGMTGNPGLSERLVSFKYDDRNGNLLAKTYFFRDYEGNSNLVDSVKYVYEPKRERLKQIHTKYMDFRMYYDDDTIGFESYLQLPQGSPYEPSEYLQYQNRFNGNISGTQFTVKEGPINFRTFYGFTYDKTNRLVKADAVINQKNVSGSNYSLYAPGGNSYYSIGDVEYSYDDIGNMLYKKTGKWSGSGSPVIFQENISNYNQSHNKLYSANGLGNAFDYDQNGNLIHDSFRGINMLYGRANLPVSLLRNNETTEYLYNSADIRIYKRTEGNIDNKEYYFRDAGGNIIAILNEENGPYESPEWEHYLYDTQRFASFRQNPNRNFFPVEYNVIAGRAMSMAGGLLLDNKPKTITNANLGSELLYDSLILGGGIVTIENFNYCSENLGLTCSNTEINGNSLEFNAAKIRLGARTILSPGENFLIRLKPIYVIIRDCIPNADSLNYHRDTYIESMKFYQYDHLGNTRVVFDVSEHENEVKREISNIIDYYPFGGILREFNQDEQKFKFTSKERDSESGYDYYEARLYDSDFGRFLQVDPSFMERPLMSPYNFVQNNPIMRIDLDGRWDTEFNVDKETGTMTKVNDKGGDETDYYNIGTTNEEGNFETDQTITVDRPEGGGNINLFRFKETENSTTSTFNIPGTDVSGFMLEPAGPSTITPNQNKRIPEGQYNLENYSSSNYPDNFRVYSNDVPKSRRILIHEGNYPSNTEGCLMPGSSTSPDAVWSSFNKFNQMRPVIKKMGSENVKLNIYNIID